MTNENRASLTWAAPTLAVDPANRFHTLYLRLAAISDALVRHSAGRNEILTNPVFGEFLGGIANCPICPAA